MMMQGDEKNQVGFNIQLFDWSKGLMVDEEIKKGFETKMRQIHTMYEVKYRQLAAKAVNLEESVNLMNQVKSENLKPKDMTMEALIELLARVEEVRGKNERRTLKSDPYTGGMQVKKRPPAIWRKFHECFGEDYFIECIEEEYGIAKGQTEKMRAILEDKFDKINHKYDNELKYRFAQHQE